MTDVRAPTTTTWPTCLTKKSTRNRTSRHQIQDQVQITAATELIAAGVDVRTVAGRLGHGGGGSTTLRVSSAWIAEADQRAAYSLAARLPSVLDTSSLSPRDTPALPATAEEKADRAPYRRIAEDLRAAIRCGSLAPGDNVPTVKELGARYGVSIGTAHRAITELGEAGLIDVSRGRRGVVCQQIGPNT